MSCDYHDRGAVVLAFYGELDAAERERFDAHLAGCGSCRAALEELDAIAHALDARRHEASPPGGDWSPFMARLDAHLGREVTRRSRSWWMPAGYGAALKVAAMAALVTAAVLAGRQWEHWRHDGQAVSEAPAGAGPSTDAVADLAEDHLERSKLVLLGLVTKDPGAARPADWRYERDLAGQMLADTAQYRLAASQQGLDGLAGVLGDLELVLLQTSLSDDADPNALARLQNLIGKRDLLVRIEVMGVVEPERPARPAAGNRPKGT